MIYFIFCTNSLKPSMLIYCHDTCQVAVSTFQVLKYIYVASGYNLEMCRYKWSNMISTATVKSINQNLYLIMCMPDVYQPARCQSLIILM